jgi:hypothetical protein
VFLSQPAGACLPLKEARMSRSRFGKVVVLVVALSLISVLAFAAAATYAKGDKVLVEWKGQWYPSTILEVGAGDNAGKFKIHYDGWGAEWDEWVTTTRMKAAAKK